MYSNPYSAKTLMGFLYTLLLRIPQIVQGEPLAADEVQVLVLVGVALSCSWVGVFLVLRRMTMLANALSHTILLGIVIAFLCLGSATLTDSHGHLALNTPILLLASLGMGMITTFATEFLTRTVGLQEDASTGVVFTTFFAMGVVLVTAFSKNAHIGTEAVMGNVDALHVADAKLVWLVCLVNAVLFIPLFKEYVVTTFDPLFSLSCGISAKTLNYLLMIQVALTAVSAFRAVGVLMVLAFFTAPVLAAKLWVVSVRILLALSSFFAVASVIFGVALSRHILTVTGIPLSTAGITVTVMAVAYLVSAVLFLKKRQLKPLRDRT